MDPSKIVFNKENSEFLLTNLDDLDTIELKGRFGNSFIPKKLKFEKGKCGVVTRYDIIPETLTIEATAQQ